MAINSKRPKLVAHFIHFALATAFVAAVATSVLPDGALLTAQDTTPAEVSEDQLRLLKIFRAEFVKVTPGDRPFDGEFKYQGTQSIGFTSQFSVAKYEVTQNLWQSISGENPSRWKGERNSVELLSFTDAVKFCKEATRLMRQAKLIDETQFVRLPTEIEWEYFAAAGTEAAFSFGDDPKQLGSYAWFTGNAAGNDPVVGEKKPNPWGLYDVHGYLWEWCVRCEEDSEETLNEEQWLALDMKSRQALRGGSWKDEAGKLKTRHRRQADPDTKDDGIGLRCVLVRSH